MFQSQCKHEGLNDREVYTFICIITVVAILLNGDLINTFPVVYTTNIFKTSKNHTWLEKWLKKELMNKYSILVCYLF